MTLKTVTTVASAIDKNTVWFTAKTTTSSPVKTVTPIKSAIDVQDDEEVVIVAEDNEIALPKDEIQDTSDEDELGNEWLKATLQAL